jgi:hypothetical protein
MGLSLGEYCPYRNWIFSLLSKRMKAGLPIINLSVSLLITFEVTGRFWNLVGRWRHWRGPWCSNFNPIDSTILKWLRFKLLRWLHCLHHSALLKSGFELFSIVGFPWLHHIPSLVHVTTEKNYVHPRWMQYLHHSALLNNGLGLWSTVGSDSALLAWSMKSGDVTMKTKVCGLLYSKKEQKALLTWSVRDLWKVDT